MKLFFTTLLTLMLGLCQAQTPGLFKFTVSDYAGNGITPDGKGAIVNFNNGNAFNCVNPTTPQYSQFNHIINAPSKYSWELDSANGILKVGIQSVAHNYSTVGLTVRILQNNCDWMGAVDLRKPENCVLEIRVKSNIDLEHFRILVATKDQGAWVMSSGIGGTDNSLVAGEWTIIKQPALFKGYLQAADPLTPMDSSQVIGFGIVGYNGTTGTTAELEIDYVRIGSAVSATLPTDYEMGRGIEWTYDNEPQNCPKYIDVLNNPTVDALYNASDEIEITQTGSAGSELFIANVFSDRFCIPLPVDMSVQGNRIINISVYSDQDIPEFAVDLNGYDEDGTWDVGTLPAYQSLTGGIVNNLQFSLPETTVNGKNFNLKRITGYGLFIPAASTSRTNAAPYSLKVSSVEAKTDAIVTSNVNAVNTSLGVYPNPSDGKLFMPAGLNGHLEIVDLSGKKLFEQEIIGHPEVNLNLLQGIYIVHFIDQSGRRYNDKLMVK